jgi:hypothetical protein
MKLFLLRLKVAWFALRKPWLTARALKCYSDVQSLNAELPKDIELFTF